MTTEDQAVAEVLRALEDQRCRAISRGDLAVLEQLLDEELVHVHATGRFQGKEEYLSSLAGRPRTTTRGDLAVRVYGDAAVMTGVLVNSFGDGEGKRATDLYATQVWVRRDGAWRLVSFAASGQTPGAAGQR
jgi:hypothetical protein